MTETVYVGGFFIGISYVGGFDYISRALHSLGPYVASTLVLDCSEDPVRPLRHEVSLPWNTHAIRPEVTLTHTQCHNYFQREAFRRQIPYYCVMHADAEASPETIERLRVGADVAHHTKKWAALFTNYDALACYSTAAAKEVGPWDAAMFPSYYSENDYYWRCKLAGYELIDTGLEVKHVGSHVINKVDKWRKYFTRLQMDHWSRMYQEKWSGQPGEEVYKHPYNISPGTLPFPEEPMP